MTTKAILTNRGYTILKDDYPSYILKNIRKELNVKPIVYDDFGCPPDSYQIYLESTRKLYLPRYYGIDKIGEPDKNKLKPGEEIDIKFKGKLKKSQEEPTQKVLDAFKDKGGGILCLQCGGGKTVCALYMITKLKRKTLVVVNKDFLLNQWSERIQQFTNASIGIIKQNKCIVKGKDIVLAMLHSISQRDYPSDTFKDFGMVIVDECHHISSRVFSRALPKISCKYTLGLSATPERKDGLSKVFYWYLGDIIYSQSKENIMKVKVNFIEFYSNKKYFKPVKMNVAGREKLNISRMISNVCEFSKRTKFIVNKIKYLMNTSSEKRYILVLSDRRNHLIKIKELLDKYEISSGLYLGGMKPQELKKSSTKDVVLATYMLVSEAFDLPKLNTLILASSKRDIEQAVGRILRKKHDIQPMIIDIADQFANFINQGKCRIRFYRKKNYDINHSIVDEANKYKEIDKGPMPRRSPKKKKIKKTQKTIEECIC